jgi:hypothetical protein
MQRAPAGHRGSRNRQRDAEQSQHSPSLFGDLDDAQRRRDQGRRAVELNTHPGWKAHAERVVAELATSGVEFTAETVRERTGHPLASHHNAFGAVLAAAARAGTIVPAGFATATRPEAHGRILRVWRGAGGGAS